MPRRLFVADALQLLLRRRLRHEIVHARLGGDGGSGQGVVTGDHHGADAHLAELCEAFLHAAFHHVLKLHDTEDFLALDDHERGAAGARNVVHDLRHGRRELSAELVHINADGFCRAFADDTRRLAVVRLKIHAAHARLRGERNKLCVRRSNVASAQIELLFR